MKYVLALSKSRIILLRKSYILYLSDMWELHFNPAAFKKITKMQLIFVANHFLNFNFA